MVINDIMLSIYQGEKRVFSTADIISLGRQKSALKLQRALQTKKSSCN